jgi:two-component system, cell cycle sensor histidine kinase and response regulator CckA
MDSKSLLTDVQIAANSQLLEALIESEARLRRRINLLAEIVFELDVDSRITFLSSAWGDVMGSNPERAVGCSVVSYVIEQDQSIFIEALRSATIGRNRGSVSVRFVTSTGTIVWTEISVAKFDRGYVGTVRDITRQKLAEDIRDSLEAQLRQSQKMEALGTLAGGIAHDFNNIVARILGNLELAWSDAGKTPSLLESLREIRTAGERARDLVQQILSFSRKRPSEFRRIALIPVVEEAVRLLRSTLPARLSLSLEIENKMPNVRADASQIEQVLVNLVTNAMQCIPHSQGRIAIRIDTVRSDTELVEKHASLTALFERHPGTAIRLSVTDNGPGMNPSTMERIFEPFFTTKPVGQGTGLGLSVVHGIVKAHDGAIEVVSNLGLGSCFTIYLPAADGQAEDPNQAGRLSNSPLPSGKHILYLDDDQDLLFIVRRLIERSGLRVTCFSDQQAALAAIRFDPGAFDLVLSDYSMPGMSGLDVARQVRAIRGDLQVAIMSGYIEETLRSQAVNAGVHHLISKANLVEDLVASLQRLLNES